MKHRKWEQILKKLVKRGFLPPEYQTIIEEKEFDEKDGALNRIKNGWNIDKEIVMGIIEEETGFKWMPGEYFYVNFDTPKFLSAKYFKEHLVLPFCKNRDIFDVMMSDPWDSITVEEVKSKTGLDIERHIAFPGDIIDAVDKIYSNTGGVLAVDGGINKYADFDSIVKNNRIAVKAIFNEGESLEEAVEKLITKYNRIKDKNQIVDSVYLYYENYNCETKLVLATSRFSRARKPVPPKEFIKFLNNIGKIPLDLGKGNPCMAAVYKPIENFAVYYKGNIFPEDANHFSPFAMSSTRISSKDNKKS